METLRPFTQESKPNKLALQSETETTNVALKWDTWTQNESTQKKKIPFFSIYIYSLKIILGPDFGMKGKFCKAKLTESLRFCS